MEEIKKEIQNLRKKALYLEILLIVFVINLLFITIRQTKDYTVIRNYYQSTQEMYRELRLETEKQNEYLKEIISVKN
ncbi:hypothetical protein MCI89_09545 [Muricomes sp. OA1]|uniref:hypothetical protein n=1 Tax=Muricomes sp. OA1 TaxID=2914165 RepID=UPI00047113D4|nr:hypothetical protein [Muricomes sp. OA1]MCH1972582.1 hypothetical protein [Muricomes sp. OA1]